MDLFGEINLTGLASVILFYLLILGVIILVVTPIMTISAIF